LEKQVMVMHARSSRSFRRDEYGFTLIEVLVSVAILAIIGGVVAAAFSVGLRVLVPGGPTDRFAGAHDFAILEQALGRDGARAGCIQVQGGTVYGKNPNVTPTPCSGSTGYGKVSACSSAALCFGWPMLGSQSDLSDSSCHVAVYTTTGTPPKLTVTRSEYMVTLAGVSTLVATAPLTSTGGSTRISSSAVDFKVPPASGNILFATAPGNYQWVRSLPVFVKATGVTSGQFSQTLALHPVASDPAGASGSVANSSGNSVSPC
jgi:prepilin-type N-terminal cleavage/methylation domain-containing protein